MAGVIAIRFLKAFVVVTVMAAAAFATTFVNRPLSEAVNEAPNIVRGKTGDSYSDYDKDHRRIFTYTRFTVTETLRGDLKAGNPILLRSPGGSKDGMEMHVPGAAQFSSDEDVVLLLGARNAEDDSYDIPGFATGKYEVRRGKNGELELINSLGAAAVYDPRKDPKTLSYNARIPLELMRKIARGETVPQATQNQFESSSKPAPPNAYEAGHKHPEVVPSKDLPNQPHPPSVPPPPPSFEPEKKGDTTSGLWVPLSFAIVGLIGALAAWYFLRNSQ